MRKAICSLSKISLLQDMTSGYIGVWSIFGNTIGTLLVSRIMDNIKGKMKLTLIILMVAAAVCWVWMGLICLRVIPFSLSNQFKVVLVVT